ncbi:TNT domain-containing protein [Catenulispora subtropica]|uniref:TNT domain-containing protein n=1 Tax=Catenulispora subtropica TaxID=450798 RepID=A0ABN2QBI0_9ACTN
MTENWQAEPSPWLMGGGEPEAGSGPQAADPTAPQGLSPMRLHVNGDVVSVGPPMVDPPRLSPATSPSGISVPQIATPLDDPQFSASQFSASQFSPPQFSAPISPPIDLPAPPPPPPFLEASYGATAYAQSPYSDASPYADKPLDNEPHVETPAPPPYSPPVYAEPARPEPVYTPEYVPEQVYTPEPVYKPEPAYAPEPIRPEPIRPDSLRPEPVRPQPEPVRPQPEPVRPRPEPVRPQPEPIRPQSVEVRYVAPTHIDSPTAPLPVAYAEPAQYSPGSQLTPVPHPSYQQHPAASPQSHAQAQPQAQVQPPTATPVVGGDDNMSTMMVAVGTVQQRAPEPVATVEDAERVLGAAVDSLDADPDLYSIGTVTDGAVCLVPDSGRWAVFLADAGQRRFAGSFDDPMMAAVHFAGVLLLAAAERGAIPKPAPASEQAALPGPDADPLARFLAGPPIAPLAGDPPTTLYTDHRLTVLTPGTEVDRFGDQLGNTVYAARTRYPHRSLPPDYVEREYRVYRVREPLRALAGTAIPWFGQPGGGTAYLLPRSIADLLREGVLVEIPEATVAPS